MREDGSAIFSLQVYTSWANTSFFEKSDTDGNILNPDPSNCLLVIYKKTAVYKTLGIADQIKCFAL